MIRMVRRILKYALLLVAAIVVVCLAYSWSLYRDIRSLAIEDNARVADAIVILGAAQYNGHPSPVLKARLDHAFKLYNQGLARTIITTGSYGDDPNFSEARVGTAYLRKLGVDADSIITEQGSGTTRDSVRASVAFLQSKNWTSVLVVSDGFHMYRVKRMFEDSGVAAFTSPAPDSPIENSTSQRFWFSLREVFLFSAYRLVDL